MKCSTCNGSKLARLGTFELRSRPCEACHGTGLETASDAAAIAEWMEGLSRHPACPAERRYWYEGVAADIRNGVWKNR